METNLTLPILFFALIFLIEIDSNLVLTPSGNYNAESSQTFTSSICLSAGSQPKFTLEYVSVSSSDVLYVINLSQSGQQSTGGSCQGTIYKYSYDLKYIDHPSLVGLSVKLRVTTQSPSFSAVSSGLITFTALYSLSASSTYATLGQDYTWTCDTSGEKPSGVPIMYICWYRGGYQSEQNVGCSAYQSGSCQTEDNNPRYNFGCNSNVYTLTIPGTHVDESEQKSMWRCVNGFRSISTSPNYTSPFKELSLAISVVNVTLLPPNIASMENVTTTIQCIPNSNAYPQPTITWYKNDVDITSQAMTDRKTITLSFTRADKGKILRCTVTGQSTSINASTTIDVIYPPSSDPVITGYDGSPLQEGDGTIKVTCRQEGGNPAANMTFVCKGNAGAVTTFGNVVTSSHTLTINRSLDKGACTCTTSHSAGNYQRTLTKTFIVFYPPLKPTVQLSAPYPWKSGNYRRLTCTTSGGNPTVYNFTWIEGATIIHIGQQLNFPSLSSSDNNRELSCHVDNAYRGGPIRSDSTTLQVEYDPQVQVDTSSTNVIEGRSFTRTCTATGNPTPIVLWYKNGGSWITQSQLSSSAVTLTNINRTDTGEYVCQATAQSQGSNDLQPDRKGFNLTVLFPPDVKVDLSGTNVNAAEVNLTCSASGLPNIYTYHGWEQYFQNQQIRDSDELSAMTIEGGRMLRLRNVTYDDMGEYSCSVNNSVPDRNGMYIKAARSLLDVKAAATFLTNTKIFQERLHASLTVMFEIYANPAVSYVIWKNGSHTIVTGNDIFISTMNKSLNFPWHTTSIMINGTQIAMEIVSFKKTHIGNYSVIIKNGKYGEIEKSFEIDVYDPPEAPENFHIVKKSKTSVTIAWTKMRNGGHQQTFYIISMEFGETGYKDERQIRIKDIDYKDSYNVTMEHLQPYTAYIIWLYAGNVEGNTSALNSPVIGLTLKEESNTNSQGQANSSTSPTGLFFAGLFCGLGIAGLSILIIFLVRRRKKGINANSESAYDSVETSSRDQRTYEDLQRETRAGIYANTYLGGK